MTGAVDLDQFFHACSWLAVQTDDHTEVARLLGAASSRPGTFAEWATAWNEPRTAARDGEFFVCEPVDGWTLVFGENIGLGVPPAVRARKFGQAHAFFIDSQRLNFFCERAIDGSTVRQISDSSEGFAAEGSPDPGEPQLPSQTDADEREPGASDALRLLPETMLRIAEAWGADPTELIGRVQAGLWCRTEVAAQAADSTAHSAAYSAADSTALDRRSKRLLAIVGLVIAAVGLGLALALS